MTAVTWLPVTVVSAVTAVTLPAGTPWSYPPRTPAQLKAESRHIILSLVALAARPGECILVFVPGIWEIADLQDQLDQLPARSTPLQARPRARSRARAHHSPTVKACPREALGARAASWGSRGAGLRQPQEWADGMVLVR